MTRFQILGEAGEGGILKDFERLKDQHEAMNPLVDEVTYQVTVDRSKLKMVIASGRVTVGDKHILSAQIKGFIGDR